MHFLRTLNTLYLFYFFHSIRSTASHTDALFSSILGFYLDKSEYATEGMMFCLSPVLSKAINISICVFCGSQKTFNGYNKSFHKPFKSLSTFVTFVLPRVGPKSVSTAAYVARGSVENLKIVIFLYLWHSGLPVSLVKLELSRSKSYSLERIFCSLSRPKNASIPGHGLWFGLPPTSLICLYMIQYVYLCLSRKLRSPHFLERPR